MSQPTGRTCDCAAPNCVGEETAKGWGVFCRKVGPKADPLEPSVDTLRPILKQRGQEYGDFAKMSGRIQRIKHAMFFEEQPVTDDLSIEFKLNAWQREALEMIATKLGRILTGNPNNIDSWADVIGYCTLVVDRIPKAATASHNDGKVFVIPSGWSPAGAWGWKHSSTGGIFNGTIEDLRKHLGLDT